MREHDPLHNSLSHQPAKPAAPVNFKLHPHYRQFSAWFDKYLYVVLLLGVVFIYLQGALIIQNKSSENISIPSFIILLIITLTILMYGILWTDWFISIIGVVSTSGSVMSLVAATSYRHSSIPGPFSSLHTQRSNV